MSKAYDPRPHPGTWADNRSRLRRRWAVPFRWLDWLSRMSAYYLSHWSFLEVLEYAGRFTVLVAVIIYFSEAPDRRKQKHYQAWQVINSAQGQSGGGGRAEALEELHHDHVPLVALNVSKAYLQGVKLPGADLHRSEMNDADLRDSDLHGANLESANLSANLRNSDLRRANLIDANLTDADLTGADLGGADLSGADLSRAELVAANLANANWRKITSVKDANVSGVRNAPEGFVSWALTHGARDH